MKKSAAQLATLPGLEKHHRFQVNLVLDELCTIFFENNRDTGDLRIDISISSNEKESTIVIDDNGTPFNPTGLDEPDISLLLTRRQSGGLDSASSPELDEYFKANDFSNFRE